MPPADHVPTEHRRFFVARRRLHWLARIEKRLAAWVAGWTLVVVAAWCLRGYEPEMVTWKMVAGTGAVQVVLIWVLAICNAWRHSAGDMLAELDTKIAEGG